MVTSNVQIVTTHGKVATPGRTWGRYAKIFFQKGYCDQKKTPI